MSWGVQWSHSHHNLLSAAYSHKQILCFSLAASDLLLNKADQIRFQQFLFFSEKTLIIGKICILLFLDPSPSHPYLFLHRNRTKNNLFPHHLRIYNIKYCFFKWCLVWPLLKVRTECTANCGGTITSQGWTYSQALQFSSQFLQTTYHFQIIYKVLYFCYQRFCLLPIFFLDFAANCNFFPLKSENLRERSHSTSNPFLICH